MEQQSASDFLKEKCVAVNMGKSRNCMLRGIKTMNSNQLLCGKGFPCRDEGLEREISLNPILLIMIPSFIHEMYADLPCMHKILHVDKNSENYTFIMSH